MTNVHHLRPLREADDDEAEQKQRDQERRDRRADHAPARSIVQRLAAEEDSPYKRLALALIRLEEAERQVEKCVDEYNAARAAIFGPDTAA